MYAWATKEYILWNMSLGEALMYYNVGIEFKYPKPTTKADGSPVMPSDMKYDDLKKLRDSLREKYGDIGGSE